MIDLVSIIQTAMDAAFADNGLYTYWQRKSETAGEADEYIVFTLSGDQEEAWSDNEPYVMRTDATLRYYYRDSLLDSAAGRVRIVGRIQDIRATLAGAGLICPYGPFDAGDVDDTGYPATVFELEYRRVGKAG